jgi:hypothetical protein
MSDQMNLQDLYSKRKKLESDSLLPLRAISTGPKLS